jgi:hypothetical protein
MEIELLQSSQSLALKKLFLNRRKDTPSSHQKREGTKGLFFRVVAHFLRVQVRLWLALNVPQKAST